MQSTRLDVSVRVYPAASETLLGQGNRYADEKSGGSVTKLTRDDATRRLRHEGASAWTAPCMRTEIVDPVLRRPDLFGVGEGIRFPSPGAL